MNQRIRFKRQMRRHRLTLNYYLKHYYAQDIADLIYKESPMMAWLRQHDA